jgi:hypothetical protein
MPARSASATVSEGEAEASDPIREDYRPLHIDGLGMIIRREDRR